MCRFSQSSYLNIQGGSRNKKYDLGFGVEERILEKAAQKPRLDQLDIQQEQVQQAKSAQCIFHLFQFVLLFYIIPCF